LAAKGGPAIEAATIVGMGILMDIDRQRIAAVRALETLGYSYQGGQ